MDVNTPMLFELERELSLLYSGYVPSNTSIYLKNSGGKSASNVTLKVLDGVDQESFGEEADLGNVENNAILKVPVKQTPLMTKVYETAPIEGSGLYGILFFSDNTGTLYTQEINFIIKEDRGVKFGYTSLTMKLNDVVSL